MPDRDRKVFLDYDQAALDAAYNQAAYAANREQQIARRASDSAAARARIGGASSGAAYGEAAIEQLDIYRAPGDRAPVFICVHGGAWRGGRAEDCAGAAEMLLAAGAHYVVPDFSWVQDVGGSLMVMADQVRRAIAWVYRNAAGFGGRSRLYLAGQSSGAHLGGGGADHRLATARSTCRPTSSKADYASAASTIWRRCGCRRAVPTSSLTTQQSRR